tara:strand:+ start:1065 stop:1343 length:279 start_codon:yes stop_codon:yes gene_type:complete
MDRLIGSLLMMGINYDVKIIDRAEYIATHYNRSPYRAPIPEPFEGAKLHTIKYIYLGTEITKHFNRSQISDVFGCLKMIHDLGLSYTHNFID